LETRKKELEAIRNQIKQTIYGVLESMCNDKLLTEIEESVEVNELCDDGLVPEPKYEERWSWTETGKNASNFAEIHPLIFTKLLTATNYFETFTERQMVGILSCFTNIRTHGGDTATTNEDDNDMNGIIQLMEKYCYEMPFNETQEFTKDAIYTMMNWTQCEDEISCKLLLSNCPISTGDFCKGILKIISILGEIEKALPERIDLLHKCSLMKPMLLKYIATSQSLYV
jgi:hypothetical protein